MSTVWIVIIISLTFSAFFSGMEIAFVSSSRLRHELDMKKKLKRARILSTFYANPSRFIGALLLGNNVSLVIYGIAMAKLLEPVIKQYLPTPLDSEFYVLIIQTILATLLILVVAEFIPKVLFRIQPDGLLKTFAVPAWLFYYLFYPFIFLYIGISELILKGVFRLRISNEEYSFSAIDLNEYVQDLNIEDNDQAFNQEIQMIQNAMDFKHVKLRDCMVPRTEIVALEINEPPDLLRNLLSETGHSKIMIYEQSIDNILGYVHAYDMFSRPASIRAVLRQVEIFPETTTAKRALNDFIIKHKSVAVVVDEFGGTSGMVTMEDIIEEIFGEIEDEYDVDDDEVIEKKISDREFIFSARLEIDYLNDEYNLKIPESDEYETLAGFILHHFGSIPSVSDQIEIAPFVFKVLKATENKLEEVKLTIL
ncbi:MAG: HlyC/CorC family transporter [Bacteroidales bacterium]|nr:HlyC/CorC family transporter [Bacteroidales bacterium]